MTCPKCQSENVNVQVVTVSKLKRKHSWLYWLTIGFWLEPILWLFLTLPMLVFKIFRPKKQKNGYQTNNKMYMSRLCIYVEC